MMGAVMKRWVVLSLFCLLCPSELWAKKYQIKELKVLPAEEYPAHQDFQNLVIGARVYNTQEEVQELFDTKALLERGIMPVLVVVENRNNFAIRIDAKDIYIMEPGGIQTSPLNLADVLVTIATNRPPSSISTRREVLLGSVNRNIRADFEHKFFGEKLIAPESSDSGIVFFPLLQGEALTGATLYLPEIQNISDGETLIFFEFELHAQP